MILHLFLYFFGWRTVLMAMPIDTISSGDSISGSKTLISKGGDFELGFFSPGNTRSYYIGIWYKKLPGKTVIWVANRENPVFNSSKAELKISEDGDLVLLKSSNSIVWSSNSSTSNATTAVLLDTGNFVLRSRLDSSIVIWQSFDQPTDTWMPGGWIGLNKITGKYQSTTAWKSPDNPAPGPFSQSLDPDGSNQFVLLWNNSEVYWSSGLWNGQFFANVPSDKEKSAPFNLTFIDGAERKFATYIITDSSVITRNVMGSDGQVRQWFWLDATLQWQPVFTQPLAHCNVYSLCGPFGICDQGSSRLCSCPVGFEPVSDHQWLSSNWNSGCRRKTKLQCDTKFNDTNHGKEDGFLPMAHVRLPANPNNSIIANANECREACLASCSFTGYSYDNGICSIWDGDFRNLQQNYDGDSNTGGTLFLRLASSDLPRSSLPPKKKLDRLSRKHKLVTAVVLGVVAGASMLVACLIGLIWVRLRKRSEHLVNETHGSLIQFTYSGLQRATKNFSEKLGGGGFGSVFKGTLPGSTQVAVKMLEGLRQGEKQFRTEVSTLGAIQHVNLVRLCGFCCQGSRRLLVYEYMSGGSLDSCLLRNANNTILDWKKRYQIILGVAKGLTYLHEECLESIIHCDIKPDNILLDADFCAKIADFGMAKLIGHDFSRALTSMRGTIGYLAPEWITGLPITPKVDVYSFGMMLLELISGKRNSMQPEYENSSFYYPSLIVKSINENNIKACLDHRLEDNVDLEELERVGRIACWCIQESEYQRPTMAQVVHMLEGVTEVKILPFTKGFKHHWLDEDQVDGNAFPYNDQELFASQDGADLYSSSGSQGYIDEHTDKQQVNSQQLQQRKEQYFPKRV